MGNNTTKKSRPVRATDAVGQTTPQVVLQDAAKTAQRIKMAADFADLGEAVDYGRKNLPPMKREAYFATLKPLRDITAFDFYSNVQRPLEELQAASATGDSAKATKAEAQLVEGLDEFAKISPKFQTYVKGLEDRIAKSEKRMDNLESIVARMLRGQFVDPTNLPWEAGQVPTRTSVLPKLDLPVTDAQSMARAAGSPATDAPEEHIGPLKRLMRFFALGDNTESYPDTRKYAGPITPTTANNGTQGKE